MQGFQGLNRAQWALIKHLFPKPPSNKFGRKDLSPKKVMNTILWVLITGARWIDIPVGSRWSARSTAHEWLGRWQETGILEKVLNLLLEKADVLKLTGFDRLKVDGFFFTGTGWRRGSGIRLQGKGGNKSPTCGHLGKPNSHKDDSSKHFRTRTGRVSTTKNRKIRGTSNQ
jgi:transposase